MQNILPYFWSNEIGPKWVNKSSQYPFGRLGNLLKDKYAEVLGMAFVTASKISHEEIQEHVLEKLKALHPLSEVSLLSVVLMCLSIPTPETAAEVKLGSWVVEHVADSYSKLTRSHPEVLDRLFGENPELNVAVMQRLEDVQREEKSGCQDEVIPAKK